MSVQRVAYVVCDGCFTRDTAPMARTGSTPTAQRVELKALGWSVGTSYGDLCPECHNARVRHTVRKSMFEQGLI